jgi:hypothetical protein
MMAIIASVGANGVCAGRIDIHQPHVIAAAGLVSDADPCMARSCFRGKRCRWDLLELIINSGTRADQYCSQVRNCLSVAFNNGLRP